MENTDKLELFIGDNSKYYMKVWKDKSNNFGNKLFISFNSAGCLFGSLWFLYRKMYLLGLIQAILIALAVFLKNYSLISQVLIQLTFGFLANYFYLKEAKKQVSKNSNEDELKKKGGTNVTIVIIVAIILIAINVFDFIKSLL